MGQLISVKLPAATAKEIAEIQAWLEANLKNPKDLILYAARKSCWICASERTGKGYTKADIEKAIKEALKAAQLTAHIGSLKIEVTLADALNDKTKISQKARDALTTAWTGIFAALGPGGVIIGGFLGRMLWSLPVGAPYRVDDSNYFA